MEKLIYQMFILGTGEALDESLESKEASTNDFFTETNLQEIPEEVKRKPVERHAEEVFSFEEIEQASKEETVVVEEISNDIPDIDLSEPEEVIQEVVMEPY